MDKATLIAREISKTFIQGMQEFSLFTHINAAFTQGTTYAITGISGSGKSTLMHILASIDKPTSGTVLFNNQSIDQFSAHAHSDFLNKSIGLVFQTPHLIRELSVIENIFLPGLIGGKTKDECLPKAEKLLEKIGLLHKKNSNPSELSGGQQQRVAIARALFNEPQFLIADEPTGNLDLATGNSIIDLLLSCRDEWGMGIIISSHDEYVTQKMDETYTLDNGILKKI